MVEILKWFYDQLSNPIFSACFAGGIVYMMMFLEAKISKKKIQRKTYTKNILLVGIIVGSIVFIITNYSLNSEIKNIVNETKQTIGGNVLDNSIMYNTNDIFLGEPKF